MIAKFQALSFKEVTANIASFLLLFAAAPLSQAAWDINLPAPKSGTAQQILLLHNSIFYVCLVIFILVIAIMSYSMIAHSKKRNPTPATFTHSMRLETVWTVIPFLILLVMAIPSTKVLIDMEDTSASELDVLVTGYQWRWSYEYIGHDVSFFSSLSTTYDQILGRSEKSEHYLVEVDKELVLPVQRKVRFLLTSADVIHAWWANELGVKKDAVPGIINEFWVNIDEPGVYRGVCAELCGRGHGFMPIVVRALSQDDFDQWLLDQKSKGDPGLVSSRDSKALLQNL